MMDCTLIESVRGAKRKERSAAKETATTKVRFEQIFGALPQNLLHFEIARQSQIDRVKGQTNQMNRKKKISLQHKSIKLAL